MGEVRCRSGSRSYVSLVMTDTDVVYVLTFGYVMRGSAHFESCRQIAAVEEALESGESRRSAPTTSRLRADFVPLASIGKWRSKELFPEGRRTCSLSHLRLSTLPDMSYDIWPIEDLPPEQIDEFALFPLDVLLS